jgi:hypothetical protein
MFILYLRLALRPSTAKVTLAIFGVGEEGYKAALIEDDNK